MVTMIMLTIVGLCLDAAGAWYMYKGLRGAGEATKRSFREFAKQTIDDIGVISGEMDDAIVAIGLETRLAWRGLLFLWAGFAFQALGALF